MYLNTKRKVNANRFTVRVKAFNSNFFYSSNVINSVARGSTFFYKYRKKSKFYNKTNIQYSSRILRPLKLQFLLSTQPYRICAIKKISNTKNYIGLCEIQMPDIKEPNYAMCKNILFNSELQPSFNRIKSVGTLFFIKLFYGYQLLSEDYNLNTSLIFNNSFFFNSGSISFLNMFLTGSVIYDVLYKKKNIKYATACGTYCMILDIHDEEKKVIVKLPSGLNKNFSTYDTAILGRNANILAKFEVLGKASNKFFLKKKNVTVRGVAMNPVDHPNGGRSKIKKPFRSVWGWVAKNNK